MKAARNFAWGPEVEVEEVTPSDRIEFKAGDDVPDHVVKDLGDMADELILEKMLKNNPQGLTKEQALSLAGVDVEAVASEEEFDEQEFREGMAEFRTKAELVQWAQGTMGLELNESATREDLEDAIVAHASGEDVEEDEDE